MFKKSSSSFFSIVLLFIGSFFVSSVQAQLLYCCIDAKNGRNCSDSLPPQCVGRAYTVRAPGGKTIKEVEAPLTPAQQKVREAALEKKKIDDANKKEQDLQDRALLSTYSSEAEIDKARQRAEREVQDSIKLAEGRLVGAEERKKKAMGDPEMYKKHGMPEDMKRKMTDLDVEIKLQMEMIESKKRDLVAVLTKYAVEKKRYIDIQQRGAPNR